MGSFLTGVAVMTTGAGVEPHGMTANAVASVSLEPPLVLVCVDRAAVMAERVQAAGTFALSFLAEHQADLSTRFADPRRATGDPGFAGIELARGITGAYLLTGAVATVECEVTDVVPGGDHLVVFGQVVATAFADAAPLAYFRGGYGRIAGIAPAG